MEIPGKRQKKTNTIQASERSDSSGAKDLVTQKLVLRSSSDLYALIFNDGAEGD